MQPCLYLHSPAVVEITGPKYIGLDLSDSNRNRPFPIGGPLDPTQSLSLTVSEIFCLKRYVLIDTMLNRHCACAISRDLYPPLCKNLSSLGLHILIWHLQLAYSLYHFHWAPMKNNGCPHPDL